MEELRGLTEVGLYPILMSVFIVMSVIVSIISLIEKFADKTGLELRWKRKQKEERTLLLSTVNSLQKLQEKEVEDTKQSIRHDEQIRRDLAKLTEMFIDKEIEDLRWEILNFASALANGQQYGEESFSHIFKIHEKYEKIIKNHEMTNGQVDVSMEFVNESYKEKLKKGLLKGD